MSHEEKMMMRGLIVAVLIALAAMSEAGADQKTTPMHFRVTDLGPGPGPDDQEPGVTLNNRGDVGITLANKAYLWHAGRRRRLPGLKGYSMTFVNAINDQGLCVGDVDEIWGEPTRYASTGVLWDHGRIVHEFDEGPGLSRITAASISNQGKIVYVCTPNGAMEAIDDHWNLVHSYLWNKKKEIDLGEYLAYHVNDAGQVLGKKLVNDYVYMQPYYLYDQGTWHKLPRLPGYDWIEASDMNDRGDIVGSAYNGPAPNPSEAFLRHNGQMTDLGPGDAYGINDSGEILGTRDGKSALWRHGSVISLNSCLPKGWTELSAEEINNRGQIVGYARHHGRLRIALLTPVQ